MNIFDIFFMALRAISRNKIRSVLTALGIVIGVASVIAMVHLGQSATRSVTDQIAAMGSNLLIVQSGGRQRGPGGSRVQAPPLELDDAESLGRDIRGILAAPVVNASSTLIYGNANYNSSIVGTTNDWFEIRNWELEEGRLFEQRELASGAAVCILGKTIVRNVFGDEQPLGASMRIGSTSCQIIGVLSTKGQSMGQDQDELVVMPLKAVQRRLVGRLNLSSIYISAVDGDADGAQRRIEVLLRERRRIRPNADDDFNVRNMAEIAATLESTTTTLTALLGAIAAVSLLVGGIGIMNIMLVSVTERTREIGVRLAIGALARDVLTQFLVEAIVLATLGGLLGVTLGIGATWIITTQMNLPFLLDPQTLIISFSFSALIGVVFGYVPARKAARLNPIESLRHE